MHQCKMVLCRAIRCILLYILFLDLCIFSVCAVEEGEPCSIKGTTGSCTALSNCQPALDLIDNGRSPQFCDSSSEVNFNALVCCHDPEQEGQEPKERISLKMCKKYYPGLFPPEGEKLSKTQAVVAGKIPFAKKFPHTALIGYDDDEDNIDILCLGSLISEKFVLTAAHCANPRRRPPTLVRLGGLDTSSTADDADPQNFTVKSITHPDRQPFSDADIALLELDRVAKFTDYVKPICLYQSDILPPVTYASAVGWGNNDFSGKPEYLQELSLVLVNHSRCYEIYKKRIANDKHICAGGNDGMGTCQGDGGGPLQIKKAEEENNVYDLIGITSFGMGCGQNDIPDVYTRVSFYLDWIEQIVWP